MELAWFLVLRSEGAPDQRGRRTFICFVGRCFTLRRLSKTAHYTAAKERMSEGAKGVESFHTQAGCTRDMAVG